MDKVNKKSVYARTDTHFPFPYLFNCLSFKSFQFDALAEAMLRLRRCIDHLHIQKTY